MATNRYGLDVTYFERWFDRSLRNISDYKPSELARELARMAKAADKIVLAEPEFNQGRNEEVHSSDGTQTLHVFYDEEEGWFKIIADKGRLCVQPVTHSSINLTVSKRNELTGLS